MALRTVGVRLTAEITQYTGQMRRAGVATQAVTQELDRAGKVGKRSLSGVSEASADLGKDVAHLGRVSAVTGEIVTAKSRGMGKEIAAAGRAGAQGLGLSTVAAARLDEQISETALEVQRLHREFQQTGDLRLFTQLSREMTRLKQQTSVKSFFDPKGFGKAGSEGAAAAATQFGLRLGPLMMSSLPSLGGFGPVGAAIGAPIGVAAAGVIGSAVAGAVVGGVGIGGVVGGIALAARNPQVKAEAKELGEEFLSLLESASAGMIPVTRLAIRDVRGQLAEIRPDLERIFAGAAKLVDPLVRGVTGLAREALPGIVATIERAAPVFDVLATGLPEVGRAVSDALGDISGDANAAAAGVDLILQGLSGIIRAGGAVIGFFMDTFRAVVNLSDAALTMQENLLGWNPLFSAYLKNGREDVDRLKAILEGTGTAASLTGAQVGFLGSAVKLTSDQVDELTEAFDDLFGAQMSLDRALIESRESVVSLSQAFDDNGNRTDINTEKGRANRRAILDRIKSIKDERQARYDQGATLDQVNAKYVKDIDGLRKSMRQAGFTKKQIDELTSAYRRVPTLASTQVRVTGDQAVARKLLALKAYQDALKTGGGVTAIRKQLSKDNADFLKFHTGGRVPGSSPTDTADDQLIWATSDEYVIRRPSARKVGRQALDYINKYGELPGPDIAGYARGGMVWPYPITAARTRIPSQREVASKVTPAFGGWPSSPGAQRGDSGVWRSIMSLVKASGIPYDFGNAYRPGDPKWHGSGRAIDFMGYQQDRLARFFMARQSQVLELIHRTDARDYAVTRGRRTTMPTQLPLHRNHLHIAMADGGVIREPVLGVGASGRTYSFAEYGPETVTPGAYRWMAEGNGGGANTTVVLQFSGPVGSQYELQQWVVGVVDDLRRRGRV